MAEAAVWAAVFAVVVAVIEIVAHPIARAIRRVIGHVLLTLTGLKAVYPRSHEYGRRTLERLLGAARSGDEILFVTRTNLFVLTNYSQQIFEALRAGATVRL